VSPSRADPQPATANATANVNETGLVIEVLFIEPPNAQGVGERRLLRSLFLVHSLDCASQSATLKFSHLTHHALKRRAE
jgi:hypothetical protein